MANTQFIKTDVEPWVRQHLEAENGQPFSSQFLNLSTGGKHEFDAVSADRTVVVSIKSASGLTAGGNLPQGKFHNAIAEVYFLSLISASRRTLLTTNRKFHQLLEKRMKGLLPVGVTLQCLELPVEMQKQLDDIIATASKEVSPQIASAAAEDEID